MADIRLARLNFARGVPTGSSWPPHHTRIPQWSGDQWELSSLIVTGSTPGHPDVTLVDTTSTGRFRFEHPQSLSWPSREWHGPTLGKLFDPSADSFIIFIYTGDDDLRTDPGTQPNSEIEVWARYADRVASYCVQLDPGRLGLRDFVTTPGTASGGTAAFYGSFENWGTAAAIVKLSSPIPSNAIQGFTVKMVRGRSAPVSPGHPFRVGGSTDPFRHPDEWSLRGLWVGIPPTGTAAFTPSRNVHFGPRWLYTSPDGMNVRLRLGETWTSAGDPCP